MGRRPSSKPKASKGPRKVDRKDSKIKKWNTLNDIPLDDEDAFHQQRDEINLSDNDADEDLDLAEDEVFALKGMPSSESSSESDRGDDDSDGSGDSPSPSPPPSSFKKKVKGKSKAALPAAIEASDQSDEEDETEEVWGRKKSAFYASNADEIPSDDEEAQEMEESEARRLQAKARELIAEDDFGFGDDIQEAALPQIDIFEAPAQAAPALPQDKASLLKHLERTNPEAIALAREWEDVAHDLVKVEKAVAKAEEEDPENQALGLIHLHHQALQTYVTTLAFYYYLRLSPKYVAKPELLASHPILSRLLTLKQALSSLEDLNFNVSDSNSEFDDEEDEDMDMLFDRHGVDAEELEALRREAEGELEEELDPVPKKRRKKTKKDKSKTRPVQPSFDLVEPTFTRTKSSTKALNGDTNTFGEATSIEHSDATDKKARKKSLQFHTSKIEGASARRQGARLNALGGDDDIPYRERKKEKDIKMRSRSGLGEGGDDLEGDDEGPQNRKRSRDDEPEQEGADGYYELVKKRKKLDKEEKQAEYDAQRAASRPDIPDDTASGPRSLTRAILVNKGLTPHRSKSVRNPRVKKRQKFEKAKKKVSSQKAVFKGGLAATGGRYHGEQSGISARIVKSVKL